MSECGVKEMVGRYESIHKRLSRTQSFPIRRCTRTAATSRGTKNNNSGPRQLQIVLEIYHNGSPVQSDFSDLVRKIKGVHLRNGKDKNDTIDSLFDANVEVLIKYHASGSDTGAGSGGAFVYYPPGKKPIKASGTGGQQEPVLVYLCINSISFEASSDESFNYADHLKKCLLGGFFSQTIQLKDFPPPQYKVIVVKPNSQVLVPEVAHDNQSVISSQGIIHGGGILRIASESSSSTISVEFSEDEPE